MATSGSIDYSVTAADVINEALEQLGVLGEGETANADQLASCMRTLNMMVKTWQADDINLFAVKKITLFLQKAQQMYELASTGDHAASTYVETAVKVGGSATDTTIDVDSITGVSDGDYIGIELDTGYLHWTTVNGAPAGDTVTITDALPSAIAVDNTVYTYTTRENRPMDIVNAVRKTSSSEIPIWIKDRKDYVDLSAKDTEGAVNQIWYDKQYGTGNLYVWPTSDNVDDKLILWTVRTIEDLDASTDDVDFPQEWYLPLMFNLAALLIPKYGSPATTATLIMKYAKYYYDMVTGWDKETSMQFEPDFQG
jgi:hypothetical protein